MREFQERRRIKKLLHSRYVIALLVVICILVGHAVWNVYGKYLRSREIANKASNNLAELESRQASLTASLDALSTPDGKEREVRDRFGVIKPGEQVIVLMDQNATGSDQTGGQGSWWSRFLGLFGL